MSTKEKIKKALFTISILVAIFFTLQIIGKKIAFAALLTFGSSKACVIFGVISLICAILFAVITKNSAMAKNNK